MTALEKIIQKCDYRCREEDLLALSIKDHPTHVYAADFRIGFRYGQTRSARHYDPIIRELCSVIEEQQKALEQTIPGLSSFDFEDLAKQWSSFAPNRQAQHFYEGALMTRTIIRDAQQKNLDSTTKRLEQLGLGEGKGEG